MLVVVKDYSNVQIVFQHRSFERRGFVWIREASHNDNVGCL